MKASKEILKMLRKEKCWGISHHGKLFNDLLRRGEENLLNYRPSGNDGAKEKSWDIIKYEPVHLITQIDS